MKNIFVLILGMTLVGCGSGGGGGSVDANANGLVASQSEIASGNYYFYGQLSNGDHYFSGIYTRPGNIVALVDLYSKAASPYTFYVRKSEGTYTKSGDTVVVSWSYETCNPVGSEVFTVTGDPSDRLYVKSGATTVQFLNYERWKPSGPDYANTATVAIEDLGCDKFPN